MLELIEQIHLNQGSGGQINAKTKFTLLYTWKKKKLKLLYNWFKVEESKTTLPIYECKKVKQVQVQLGYGKSEPTNIFKFKSSTQMSKYSSTVTQLLFKFKLKYKFKTKYRFNDDTLGSTQFNNN